MRAQYFSGLVSHDGRTFVMRYKAVPTVQEMDAVQGIHRWGSDATSEERLALASHLLRGHAVPEHMVQEFADDVIRQMTSGAMWLLAEDAIMDWVETRRIAA